MSREAPRFGDEKWTLRDVAFCLFGAAGLALILLFLAVISGALR